MSQLASPLGDTGSVRYSEEQILEAFNAFQSVIRRGEPFMCPHVYKPARKIATLARDIICNVGKQESIQERRSGSLDVETNERLAEQQIQTDEQTKAAFAQIEELFQQVSKAIGQRVRP